MKVNLKCFASLATDDSCSYKTNASYDIDEGQTVEELIRRAGIDREKVKVAFVNSRSVDLGTVLSDGDRIGLAPSVGGM